MRFRRMLMTSALGLVAAGAAWSAAGAQTDAARMDAAKMDGDWVHLTGDVVFTAGDELGLDYGDGFILVEMDDQDSFREASLVDVGDRITVRGRVDADFAELKSVEADTVFVHDQGVLYKTSYADDEPDIDFAIVSFGYANPLAAAEEGTTISASGTIEAIDGETFTLDAAGWNVQVDTAEIAYSPFRTRGVADPRRTVLEVGDRVRVTGEVSEDMFNRNVLAATSLVMLEDASRRPESG